MLLSAGSPKSLRRVGDFRKERAPMVVQSENRRYDFGVPRGAGGPAADMWSVFEVRNGSGAQGTADRGMDQTGEARK